MRTLWRSSASLLRRYPILWLPLIVADATNFYLNWIERLIQHSLRDQLISWLSQGHTVLSDAPVYATLSKSETMTVVLLTVPLDWAVHFSSTVLYTSAMLITAAMLHNLAETGQTHLAAATDFVASSYLRILVFSAKLLALLAASAVLALPVLALALKLQTYLERSPYLSLRSQLDMEKANLSGYVYVLPLMLAIAYIIAPVALQLLRPPNSIPTPQERRRARIAALIVTATVTILGFVVPRIEILFLQQLSSPSSSVIRLTNTIVSVITALPYVLLYIIFYLIANPGIPLLAVPGNPQSEARDTADPAL